MTNSRKQPQILQCLKRLRIQVPGARENPSIYLVNVSLKWSVSICESSPALIQRG